MCTESIIHSFSKEVFFCRTRSSNWQTLTLNHPSLSKACWLTTKIPCLPWWTSFHKGKGCGCRAVSIASSFYTHNQACPGMVPSDTQKQPALLSTPSPCSVVPSTHDSCFCLGARMLCAFLTSLLCSLNHNHNMEFFPKLEVEGEFKAPLRVAIILPERMPRMVYQWKTHYAISLIGPWGGGGAKKGKRFLG